jgi:HAE1 family hydrophobic/amphiphilic exporter-1
LTSRFGKHHRFKGKNLAGRVVLRFEEMLDWITEGFVTALRWALNSWTTKLVTMFTALALFGGAFLLVTEGYIGNAFFDPGERGEFLVEIELPKDASLAQTNAVTKQVETWLRAQPEVVSMFSTIGTNNKSFGMNSSHVGEILVFLTPLGNPRTINTAKFARQTKLKLEETIAGGKIKTSPIDILGLSFSPIEIMFDGPNLDSLLISAEQIKREMAQVPGCVEIESSVEAGNPEIKVDVNRQRLADYGLTMAQVGLALQTAFSGNTDAKYRDGDYEYPIRIALDAFDRRSTNDIKQLSFVNPLGNPVYLKQFAEVRESSAPSRLERRDRLPSVLMTAQVIGRPSGTVTREIKKRLDAMKMPAGSYVKYGGDFKRQEQGIKSLGYALIYSLILVYLIMVALYDNWVYPFVVLVSIPLSVIGAFLALALARQNLTVFTGLGLLMLVGLVGKNAILVVDFANHLRREGVELKEALLQATKLRFRPVLMTNIAMVIGLLPLALTHGPGSDWKNGLAWAIIGGLNSSMFLSLIVVPVVYWMFDRMLNKLGLDKEEKIELEE